MQKITKKVYYLIYFFVIYVLPMLRACLEDALMSIWAISISMTRCVGVLACANLYLDLILLSGRIFDVYL